MKKDLLFEIGTEDIPPSYLTEIGEELRNSTVERFEKELIDFGEVNLFYTPRRLALLFKKVSEQQKTQQKTVKGPPVRIGIDEEGNYTKAAKGFAENENSDTESLYRRNTDQGEYLFLDKTVGGKATSQLLKDIFPSVVKNLRQPEKMRWDQSGISFVRPIRWLVCLLGEDSLPLEIGDKKAGNSTRGHRFMSPGEFEISRPAEYKELLRENYVLVDPADRKESALSQAKGTADELDAELKPGEDFLDILSNSLEFPTVVKGNFPKKYLNLPTVLLYSTLREQSRLIPVQDERGEPKPYFIGFRDGGKEATDQVKKGYESVIKSRLRDTQFFFDNDRSKPLAEYVSQLKKITFQEELGTIWDKVSRTRQLANFIHKETDLSEEQVVDRAAFLCKADLVTEIVDEYPKLQGKIGAIYSELDGENKEVVEGIKEQYKPKGADDPPPSSSTGIVISMADKLDTLLGSFFVGEKPTGSKDPYGLRRKAEGIIKTIVERELDLDLSKLLDRGADLFDFLRKKPPTGEIKEFFVNRLRNTLEKNYDLPYDVVSAVTQSQTGNIYDVYCRAKALNQFKGTKELNGLLAPFERIKNITVSGDGGFDPDLFRKEEEKKLWQEYIKKSNKIDDAIENKDYVQAIEYLTQLKEPIDSYFDNVLVMADDDKIKDNRISFLIEMQKMFEEIGDLTEIVEEE